MSIVSPASPSVQSGLDRLSLWLATEGYNLHAIGVIRRYAADEGTLAGCPGLNPGDEEHAEHAYCEGLEPVAGVSPEWDEHCSEPTRGPVYNTVGADFTLDVISHRLDLMVDAGWPIGYPELDEAAAERRELATAFEPPPITGGSPDDDMPRPWRSAAELAEWTRRALGDAP